MKAEIFEDAVGQLDDDLLEQAYRQRCDYRIKVKKKILYFRLVAAALLVMLLSFSAETAAFIRESTDKKDGFIDTADSYILPAETPGSLKEEPTNGVGAEHGSETDSVQSNYSEFPQNFKRFPGTDYLEKNSSGIPAAAVVTGVAALLSAGLLVFFIQKTEKIKKQQEKESVI